MKRLSRTLCALGLLISLLLPLGGVVLAQGTPTQTNPDAANPSDSISNICKNADPSNLPPSCKPEAQVTPDTPNPLFGPSGILTKVINILSMIVGIVSVFVIIIAGVKFITSSGDPSSVTSSRNTILYAVIALAITASAQIAVRFILSKLHF